MSRYSDDEVDDVTSKDNYYDAMNSTIEGRMKTERQSSRDDQRNESYNRHDGSPNRNRSPRRRSPSNERRKYGEYHPTREIRRGSRSPNRGRRNMSGERRLEEGERHSSGERRNDDKARKRRRSSSSSSSESARMSEDTNNELPMTLTWSRVEKTRNERGEKVYASGIPRLTEEYRTQMEEIEKEKAERKEMEKDGLFIEPNIKRQKTLTTYFNQMKHDFRDIKDWLNEPQGRAQKYYRDKDGSERRITIAVQKWPEPDFDDTKQENDKATGMCTVAEKKRWHHRSKYEAVYACDAEDFNKELERNRRQTDRGRPSNSNMEALGRDREQRGNANMEAIGNRTRPDDGRPRESLLQQMGTRRSPVREDRSSGNVKVEGENRHQDESYARGSARSERNGYDRYSKSDHENESRRERSPRDYNRESYPAPERREYDQNRSQERPRSPLPMTRGPRTPPPQTNHQVKNERSPSPRSRFNDRARRTPERESYGSSLRNYQQMRENPSPRDMQAPSLQSSRRESYEYDDRRGSTRGNDSYVKRERV